MCSTGCTGADEMPGILNDETLESLAPWLHESENQRSAQVVADVLNSFDVCSTARRVVTAADTGQYNVALQFPDSLICFAPLVSEGLRICSEAIVAEQEVAKNVFYFSLGDTSSGECCVDEVAAQHLSADLIIHYGTTCFSPTRTLPVSYIFPKQVSLDPERASNSFRKAVSECISSQDILRVVLLYDLELHSHFHPKQFQIDDVQIEYSSISESISIESASLRVRSPQEIVRPGDERWTCEDSRVAVGALALERGTVPMSQTAFLWFTAEGLSNDWHPALRNAALQLSTGSEDLCAGFFCASLTDDSQESNALVNSYSILKKRLAAISKVTDAQRIGIVPGTLGISGNVEVIERCKRVIDRAKKRSYTILVGKPNPTKLANFPEIDAFVLVACPYNALLEGRDYFQAIVTPLELEAALLSNRDIFSTAYSTDFRDLLMQELPPELVGSHGLEDERSVSARGSWSVSVREAGGAAEFLQQRSWQGLKYSQGSTDNETELSQLSTEIRQGQAGVASKYDKELKDYDSSLR